MVSQINSLIFLNIDLLFVRNPHLSCLLFCWLSKIENHAFLCSIGGHRCVLAWLLRRLLVAHSTRYTTLLLATLVAGPHIAGWCYHKFGQFVCDLFVAQSEWHLSETRFALPRFRWHHQHCIVGGHLCYGHHGEGHILTVSWACSFFCNILHLFDFAQE